MFPIVSLKPSSRAEEFSKGPLFNVYQTDDHQNGKVSTRIIIIIGYKMLAVIDLIFLTI
jgi:hypothetical protein